MAFEFLDRTDAFEYRPGEDKPSGQYTFVAMFPNLEIACFNSDGILEVWDAKRYMVSGDLS